jgi:ketosteroid isomerase-like protein
MSHSHTETDAVRAASEQFYDALDAMAKGDASAMAACWSHADDVTTMHPIGGREEGWEAVKDSWEGVASMSEGGEVTRTDQHIQVTGDLAYELCTESASMAIAGEQLSLSGRATNVYRKEKGQWNVVHHHADFHAGFAEIIANIGS